MFPPTRALRIQALEEAMRERIIILDGAQGTMYQAAGLREADFHYPTLTRPDDEMRGCNDILCLSRPDVVASVSEQYLQAGADIICTDSFNANALSLSDYGLQDHSKRLAREAAALARSVADKWMATHPETQKWVAGSVGPSNKSLSISPDVADPAARSVSYGEMLHAFATQIAGLAEGGADFILFETFYDTLNLKCALQALSQYNVATGAGLRAMVSVTLTESGRLLSGQTIAALLASIAHATPLAIGLNCGFGADGMAPWARELRQHTTLPLCLYPNAGLPDELGHYNETPGMMAAHLQELMQSAALNIVGGCCGTTPAHIAALRALADKCQPYRAPRHDAPRQLTLSGLEPLTITPDNRFVNIGERCNVAGSRKFLRLISEGNYTEALTIARTQVENGAQVIDINMDDAMLDSRQQMCHFLRLIAAEPDIARVPVMIDSSDDDVILAALQCVQGKSIVNSISLKGGHDHFVRMARAIQATGAAVVVMAFDEQGQADTFERKTGICQRAYDILTQEVHFPACDIIFDPAVLAVATGIEAHDAYALAFIQATRWIKAHLPGAKVSGGVSNLSFSFRGNDYVRQAMHSVFLYHAIAAGMDMGIVNAAAMMPYEDVPGQLRQAIEDVLLCRRANATEALVAQAAAVKGKKVAEVAAATAAPDTLPPAERLSLMVQRGLTDGLTDAVEQARLALGTAIAVVDGPLMDGITRVGELFGKGKLFLPQVVKSARVMKQAVETLQPSIESEKAGNAGSREAGRVVIATVKGDVHDIGKNIVAVVLRCNGFRVLDLGVMVPPETIIAQARDFGADIIALSGLITPSLEEMRKVVVLAEREGLSTPVMVGGATTSALHTALTLAPEYHGVVAHTHDAASMAATCARLLSDPAAGQTAIRAAQAQLRERHNHNQPACTLAQARAHRPHFDYAPTRPATPGPGHCDITVGQARKLINWRAFFAAWQLDASFEALTRIEGCDCCRAAWLASVPEKARAGAAQAMQLYKEACRALDKLERDADDSIRAIYALLPANSHGDDIVVDGRVSIPTLRQLQPDADGHTLALSDYIAPDGSGTTDYIGAFAVTAGEHIASIIATLKRDGEDYRALLYQSLADRLAEAATELLHSRIRNTIWAYTYDSAELDNPHNLLRHYYKGIRPAVGYPSLPCQDTIFLIDRLMPLRQAGITLTCNGAMSPAASTCGLMIAHPQSRYFTIGAPTQEQQADYRRRYTAQPQQQR